MKTTVTAPTSANRTIQRSGTLKFGLLGGGQLARMLAQAAAEMGLDVYVFSEFATDPAALVVRNWHQGSLHDRDQLAGFLRSVDIATFESEFMNAEWLAELSAATGTAVFPRPQVMGLLQDRLSQKQSLMEHDLPTADFIEADLSAEAVRAELEKCLARWPRGLVLKKRRGGYDGYGTFIVRSREELSSTLDQLAANGEVSFIAEELTSFSREVAVMVARSRDGSKTSLPFVETHQENSRCLWVQGPLRFQGPETASGEMAAATIEKLEHYLQAIDYVGVMGVEFFETPHGLLINELAPRVHNSAHYSIEGLTHSQFVLHLQAVLGEHLSQPTPVAPGFAMVNLLGSHSQEPRWQQWPEDIHFHWYQKLGNRAGRKMGHLTAVAETSQAALARLQTARSLFNL